MTDDLLREVIQADRRAAVTYLSANEKYWIDRVSSINGATGATDPLVQAFKNHRLAFASPTPEPSGAVVEALKEAESLLALVEHPSIPDTEWAPLVQGLGERIGYGNLMATASVLWRKAAIVEGCEFVAGPCQASVTKALATIRTALASLDAGSASS